MGNDKRVIVTASDENYAGVCLNLLESLGKWSRITYVIDLGLTSESRRALASRCAGVIDAPEHAWKSNGVAVPYAAAMTLRPQLPQLFAQDYIMWIDADCWVQDRTAVKKYFEMAQKHQGNFVLVAELDVEYPHCVDAFEVRQEQLRDLHSQLWDDTVAEELHGKAPLNAGVFAASRSSPVWSAYDEAVKAQYVENSKLVDSTRLAHMAEQQSLNRVLHESQRLTILTADYNWVTHFGPLVRRGFFVETQRLRRRPRIVHLTVLRYNEDDYRKNHLFYESRSHRIVRFVRDRFRA